MKNLTAYLSTFLTVLLMYAQIAQTAQAASRPSCEARGDCGHIFRRDAPKGTLASAYWNAFDNKPQKENCAVAELIVDNLLVKPIQKIWEKITSPSSSPKNKPMPMPMPLVNQNLIASTGATTYTNQSSRNDLNQLKIPIELEQKLRLNMHRINTVDNLLDLTQDIDDGKFIDKLRQIKSLLSQYHDEVISEHYKELEQKLKISSSERENYNFPIIQIDPNDRSYNPEDDELMKPVLDYARMLQRNHNEKQEAQSMQGKQEKTAVEQESMPEKM